MMQLRFEELLDVATDWSIETDRMSIELLDQSTLRLNLQSGKFLSTIAAR
ncbi:hypothetical protein [Leptolyngbya sp. NIES-2104]|nr:hypothetical protein [Leptolyngbya sp. NIES-2104]GAP95231.1 hypothetical protein NIES2104_17510 [Leptolyngbya sp. NIES-2104]